MKKFKKIVTIVLLSVPLVSIALDPETAFQQENTKLQSLQEELKSTKWYEREKKERLGREINASRDILDSMSIGLAPYQ